jgi:hypothetical protein
MNCNKARELFSERYEDALSPALREAFDRHIHACPACEHDYRAFQAVWPLLADQSEVPATPPDLAEKIARRLDHTDWQRSHMITPWTWRLAPALVAAVVLAFLFLWGPLKETLTRSTIPAGIALHRHNRMYGTFFDSMGHRLVFFGVEGTKYRLLLGGSHNPPFPPVDAQLIEEGTFTSNDSYSRVLTNQSPNGGALWLDFAIHDDLIVLVLPETTPGAQERTQRAESGAFLDALQAFATRYGTPVLARIPRDRQVSVEGFEFGGNMTRDAAKLAKRAGMVVGFASGTAEFSPAR